MSDLVTVAVEGYVALASAHVDPVAAVEDAAMLAAAIMDADGRHTTSERAAYRHAFGDRIGRDLPTSDTQLVADHLAGRSMQAGVPRAIVATVGSPTPDGEAQHPSWQLYRAAMEVVHAVVALDAFTSQAELDHIARVRQMLLGYLDEHAVPRPAPNSAINALLASVKDRAKGVLDGMRHDLDLDAGPPRDTGDAPQAQAAPAEQTTARVIANPGRDTEDVLADLDELVGLDEVKRHVSRLADLLKVRALRDQAGYANPGRTEHAVFVGNPGTGKTTVARLLGELYAAYGVVESGHLVETDRSGLVAEYVGQTAIKTRKAIDAALDGILLIDEAYALARGGPGDFGKESIDALVKAMEDNRDRLVIVAAGYPEPMAQFLSANPGLSSRFATIIPFPDYTDHELAEIFELMAVGSDYLLDDEARAALPGVFADMTRGPTFGNARAARNLFEAAMGTHAQRVAGIDAPTDDDLWVLTFEDLRVALVDTGYDAPEPDLEH
ncbi:MAG TPA: AAA family ATPase [Nitriliruptorales bacterium]